MIKSVISPLTKNVDCIGRGKILYCEVAVQCFTGNPFIGWVHEQSVRISLNLRDTVVMNRPAGTRPRFHANRLSLEGSGAFRPSKKSQQRQ